MLKQRIRRSLSLDASALASAAHFAAVALVRGRLVSFVPFSCYVPLVFVCLIGLFENVCLCICALCPWRLSAHHTERSRPSGRCEFYGCYSSLHLHNFS